MRGFTLFKAVITSFLFIPIYLFIYYILIIYLSPYLLRYKEYFDSTIDLFSMPLIFVQKSKAPEGVIYFLFRT